jgi:hypothetical protein
MPCDDRRTDFTHLNFRRWNGRPGFLSEAGVRQNRSETHMKKVLFATILLAGIPAMAADEPKPLPQDSQVKMLKAQRDMQQLQMKMSSLQDQYKDAVNSAKVIQAQMESECVVAAKSAGVDLTKYNCDVDKLTFVLKPAPKAAAAEPAAAPKETAQAKK